jgi:hypothetical protein
LSDDCVTLFLLGIGNHFVATIIGKVHVDIGR